VTSILFAILCLAANAFFVAAEFALAKVRPTSLDAMARAGDKKAKRALGVTRRLDAYLTATQIGITLASLGLGSLEPALAKLIEPAFTAFGASPSLVEKIAFALTFAAITMLHIVLGELIPKSYAIQQPENVARNTSLWMVGFYWLIYPALILLNSLSNFTLRLVGLPPAEHAEGKLSLEELRLVVRASLGEEGEKKRELLERVLRGTDRPLRAVMVPRVDMTTLSIEDDFQSVLDQVRRHGFSRYPIAEHGDPDKVLGYVYVKDVLMASRPPRDGLRGLKRDVLFAPESLTVGELLGQFQRTKIPIAIVVDEYGGTSGLVTLEDVVEEIVGELQDEHDFEQPRITRLENGTVVVDGSLPFDELAIEGLELPPREGGETIGGYVVATLGRLAHPGDRVRLGKWDAVVEDVRRRRVNRVSFVPVTASTPPPPLTLPPPPGEDEDG
jgi:CBS domain containing-hemolysin-like protein